MAATPHSAPPSQEPIPIGLSIYPSRAGRIHLPRPLARLIGRESELALLRDLLLEPEHRLVTVTGPGGVGKSRLAITVAADLVEAFPDGCWFVSLAPLVDPDLVLPTIVQTLGVGEPRDQSVRDFLVAYLRRRCMLLVLDNVEQIVAAAPLLSELLADCPELHFLVTSRATLRVYGERVYPLSPLTLPPRDDPVSPVDQTLAEIASAEAVRLFVDRARAVRPDFALTMANAGDVATVCHRLDGLPLAIELAAARLRHLPLPQLVARLSSRLPVLTDGPRDLPARHRTMHNAIGWSYDLLTPVEQRWFRSLAVFAGGFTLPAADWVASDGAPVVGDDAARPIAGPHDPPLPILGMIGSLVDQSLLQRDESATHDPRFTMLETVREYGLAQLAVSGEESLIRDRHAHYCLLLAEAAEPKLRGPEQVEWLDRLDVDHDNLRAALAWSLTAADGGATAVRLAGALHWFWYLRGHHGEGRRWLAEALARPAAAAPTAARAKALAGEGILAFRQSDYPTSRARLAESIAIGRALADPAGVAYGSHFLAMYDLTQGVSAELRALAEASVALFREVGDRWGLASSLRGLGMVEIFAGRLDGADAAIAESLALTRAFGDTWGLAKVLHYSGELARARGDDGRARADYEESLALYGQLGHRFPAATVRHNLGYVAQHQGDLPRAVACFAEALAEHLTYGDWLNIGHCLGGLAGIVGRLGHAPVAARLFGAAAVLVEAAGASIWPIDRVDYEGNLAAVRADLGEEAFRVAFDAGRVQTLEEAAAVAALVLAAATSSSVAGVSAHELTPRERQVLELLAAGQADKEIATALGISRHTAGHHVRHILEKLGLESRAAAAAFAVRHHLA